MNSIDMANKRKPPERPSQDIWQVESLRFTAFPTPDAQIEEPTWWKDLIGEPAERKVSAPKRRILQEEGAFSGGKLMLSIQPLRIDWTLSPSPSQQQELDALPTIGLVSDSLRVFSELIERWIQSESFPPVKRIALGTILLHPVENGKQGYEQLSAYLPAIQLDTEHSSDFSYQINRPRASVSGLADLKINRVSRWSVALMRAGSIAVGPQTVESVMGREHFACRLELDINTAADFAGSLPRERLPAILHELASFGEEIVREGDVP